MPVPDYVTLKLAHQICVAISLPLYFLRLGLALRYHRRPQAMLARSFPHLVDSLLLLTGVSLMLITGWSPLLHSWLGAKLLLLVLYILVGGVALRCAYQRDARAMVIGGIALLCAGSMLALALNKPSLW